MLPVDILPVRRPLERIGARGRIGLLALATDLNSETDLRRMAPAGVELFTSRIANANPVTIENLRAMAGDITRAARTLLPGLGLDVCVYGCTSGTVAIGAAGVVERIQAAHPGVPVTTPIAAATAALDALRARAISILTPYTPAVAAEVGGHFAAAGFAVCGLGGFGLDCDDDMAAVPPAAIVEAGLALCDPAAEVLFVSCTALPAARFVQELEDRLGKPVVASNQAVMWHALRLIGVDDRVPGCGRLFGLPLPERPRARA